MTKIEQSYEVYDMAELQKLLAEYDPTLKVECFTVTVKDKNGVQATLNFNSFNLAGSIRLGAHTANQLNVCNLI